MVSPSSTSKNLLPPGELVVPGEKQRPQNVVQRDRPHRLRSCPQSWLPVLTDDMVEQVQAVQEKVSEHALEAWLNLDYGGEPLFDGVPHAPSVYHVGTLMSQRSILAHDFS